MHDGESSRYILKFSQAVAHDHPLMGGKCASLARMIAAGVAVPPCYEVLTEAYAEFLAKSGLSAAISDILTEISVADVADEEKKSASIRALILHATVPAPIEAAIRAGYAALSLGGDLPVAVRSSATAEDMPDASFAGQQDTYLWVVGAYAVVAKVKSCWADDLMLHVI
jgi:pyruvate,water dikinase